MTTAMSPRRTLTSLVDLQRSFADTRTIHRLNSRIRLFIVRHLNKTKTLRTTSLPIRNNVHPTHCTKTFKLLTQIIFVRAVSQIAYVDIHRILLSAACETKPGTLPFGGKKKQPPMP
jgi:hypothetical protein